MFYGDETGVDDLATPGLFPSDSEEEGVGQKIYLPQSMWEGLTEVAAFETEIRKFAKSKQYSRAKLIKYVLGRYLAEYWPGVGGKPENAAEAKQMAKREADRRLAEAEEARKPEPKSKK